ncbi:MAG: hypothetical protein U1F57_05145 [bacterium]
MKVFETILFVLVTFAIFGFFVYYRVKEQRYLKKKTSEVFSKRLREEIDEEVAENKRKREKFQDQLKRFGGPET